MIVSLHIIYSEDSNVKKYFDQISEERRKEKEYINSVVKNTSEHIDALNDGVLPEGYVRSENIFGQTQEDNVFAKLLLLFNKVFNKKEKLSNKDLTTLKNLRNSVCNVDRNSYPVVLDNKEFYSDKLDDLFFNNGSLKNDDEQLKNDEIVDNKAVSISSTVLQTDNDDGSFEEIESEDDDSDSSSSHPPIKRSSIQLMRSRLMGKGKK